MADCVEQLRAVVEAGVDFVEVSGGSFEDPKVCFVFDSLVGMGWVRGGDVVRGLADISDDVGQ
jgi:hypothetical protein